MNVNPNLIPRVKICGITSVEDAHAAIKAGADAIGLVFYKPSVRNVSDLGLAKEIALEAGPFTQIVGLFVDAEAHLVDKVRSIVPLNTLQFHGAENAQYCEKFDHPYIKALRMKPGFDVIEAAAEHVSARGVLLDTYVKGIPGGTGETFNWDLVPKELENVILAGGLTPDNVHQAVQAVQPYAVDVSGGVEQSPGKKDIEKVNAFIRQAKLEHCVD